MSDDIRISWTDESDNEEGFRVYRSRDDGSSWTQIADLAPGTTQYDDTSLLDGEEYVYKVEAYTQHASNESDVTSPITTVLPDEDQPVLGNGVEDEIAIDRESVVSDYGSVRIQVRETGQSTWDETATGFAEQTLDHATLSTTFAGREDGEEYEVRVRTETEHVTGAWTSPVAITTAFPGASGLAVGAVTTTSVALSWTDNADNEDGMVVERARVDDGGLGPWRDVADLPPNTTSYTDDTVSPNREYRYRIRAFTEHTDAISDTVTATTASTDVRQHPVPTSGWRVEVDHPNRSAPLTPQVLEDGAEFPHAVNSLPQVTIPIPKASHWLEDAQLENQPMRVWKDGERLPIGTLENVRERPDRVILEGRGALALTQRVQTEFTERAAHLGAGDIIDQTGLAKTIDDPATSVQTDDRMQSADSTAAWSDHLASAPAPEDVVRATDGTLTTHQTAFFAEAENVSRSNGTEQIENESDRWSGDRVVEYDLEGVNYYLEWTFETGHTIPAEDVAISIRTAQPSDGHHGFEVILDGETLADIDADVLATNRTEPSWFDPFISPSSDLAAGSHTLRIQLSGPSSQDGTIQFDCLGVWDDRHDPGFTEQVTDGVITGPDLYPSGVEQQTDDAVTFLSIVAGELTSAWNDISGDQAVAISNDLGQTWIEATNSETVSGEFDGGQAQIRARFRLAGYDDNPDQSPAGRKQPQTVDLYDLYADLEDTPLLIGKVYDGQAIDVLTQIAEYGDFIFSIEWDGSIGGYRVVWTQPGIRTTERTPSLTDYETAKVNENSYERVVIKGQAKQVVGESIAPDPTYELEQEPLVEGAGRVYDPDTGTTYTEGADYKLDRIDGTITIIDDGAMSSGEAYEISYSWKITGAYEPPDAPSDPKTLVRDVPSLPSARGCDQAALYLYRVVDEPLIEATATLDEIPPGMSAVETVTIPDLPTGDEAVEVRTITQQSGSPTITLGSRQGLGEAIGHIRSQLQAVSRLV